MKLTLIILALASSALAQDGVTRGDALKRREYQTYGTVNLFVDPTGNDSNACTEANAGACATVNGAWNKLPRFLRHNVNINVDAGTYAGGIQLRDVQVGPLADAGTVTFNINGAPLVDVVPTTGTATGTLSAIPTVGFATTTLTSVNTWTVDNLVGRHIVMTSGPANGADRLILANTATTLTVWPLYITVPASGDSYAIRDVSTIIDGCGSTVAEVRGVGVSSLQLSRLGFSCNATGNSVLLVRNSAVSLNSLRVVVGASATSTGGINATSSFVSLATNPSYVEVIGGEVGFVTSGPIPRSHNLNAGVFVYTPTGTGRSIAVASYGLSPTLAARRDSPAATVPVITVETTTPPSLGSFTSSSLWVRGGGVSTSACVLFNGLSNTISPSDVGSCLTGYQVGGPSSTTPLLAPTTLTFNASTGCNNVTNCVSVRSGSRAILPNPANFVSVTNQYVVDGTAYTEALFSSLSPPRIVGPNMSVLER